MCLRQKNVKKKECSPPSERDLRLGLLITLPNSLSFSSRDFLWYFSGCKARHCIPWLGLLHNSCTQKQEKISEFSSGVLSSRNIPLIYPVWVRSSMIILPKTPSTMSCKTLISAYFFNQNWKLLEGRNCTLIIFVFLVSSRMPVT